MATPKARKKGLCGQDGGVVGAVVGTARGGLTSSRQRRSCPVISSACHLVATGRKGLRVAGNLRPAFGGEGWFGMS